MKSAHSDTNMKFVYKVVMAQTAEKYMCYNSMNTERYCIVVHDFGIKA